MLEQWKKSFHYVHLFLELLKEPNLNENMICEKIITIFGQDYGIISTFMMEATKYGTVKDIGSFGVLQTYSNDWHEFSIDKKLPVNDALNENKIVWVNTLPYWTEEYRLLSNLELDNRSKTFIAIPFSCLKYPRAVLGMFSEIELESTTELVYSLRIITSIWYLSICALYSSWSCCIS